MSDTQNTPVDSATVTVATSESAAPPVEAGETQGSAPASAETAATESSESEKSEQRRRESKRNANHRREVRDLSRQIGYLQAQLEQRSAAPQQQQEGESVVPQQRPTPSPQQIAAAEADSEATQTVIERLEDAGEDVEGFDKVMQTITAPNFPISTVMRDFLGETEHPAQLAKMLADDPKEALRISRLSQPVAFRALEKLEAKIAKAPAGRKTTQAPAPLSRVGGSTQAAVGPNGPSGDMDDYAAWRRRQA